MNAPKHTPIQSETIASDAVSAAIFRTYARLVGLAWKHDFKYTDWLGIEKLSQQLGGLDRATILRHIGQLKTLKWLDWKTDGKKRYKFFILEVRLDEVAKSHFCDPSSSSGINSVNEQDLPLLDKSQKCDLDLIIDTEAWEALRAEGIGEPSRTILANQPNVTAQYVRAMAAQARRDGVETGALIYRMRNDWPAPDWCNQCGGLDGGHTDACPTQSARRAELSQVQSGPEPAAAISTEMRLWQQVLGELQLQLTGATYETWLSRTRLISADGGLYTIGVHNGYAKDWLENRLAPMIQRTLAGVVGADIELRFVVKGRGNDER